MSHKEKVCIKVPKVYDWVTRQVDLPLINFTGSQLDNIDFDCNGVSPFDNICDFLEAEGPADFSVRCFLSNKWGQPINPKDALKDGSLICQEILQPGGREDVPVTLPTGETVTLQKVKVLVKGFVGVDVVDAAGTVICRTTKGIQFATAQTFILCAPEGTEVDCHISFFECDASLICMTEDQTNFQQLDISITLCLEVQMEAKVKLEVEGRFCKPREEILAATLCPEDKFPPQCPEIFPARC